VLMSEMITENDDVRAQVNVSYQSEPVVGLLVQIEIHEQYAARRYKATITGLQRTLMDTCASIKAASLVGSLAGC
jgi:hypothetical protein